MSNNSWGPLGNPTKEDIERYMNMPVGQFKNYTKRLRGKKPSRFQFEVIERVYTDTIRLVTVDALNINLAGGQALTLAKTMDFSEQPNEIKNGKTYLTRYMGYQELSKT